ncbi:ABC transporter ATP-binding protein [Cesiribacter andamanensis]|uniref:Putative ABC transporter ATP-binding protein YbhF n=1 Tax=Cesiribacter andamanensis AMV16 TaxID=1279009 RepID=M7NMT8_9BACT|nr:ABC transporter ATP-binding protein [Cesiribacter andamanensis]EMR03075.1 putative ABC transporter ATP-binding protein YbhF [Cesiribacter andamanensis AMV16]
MDIISTYRLCKSFGSTTASDAVSLQVQEGEIWGFLGLNGAGKTTLIRMLLGMIRPDSGNIRLFGQELNTGFNQWNDIGYLVETPFAYPELTVAENLKIYYKLRQLKQPALIDEVIDRLKLSPYRTKKAKVLSMGNQQRLGLAKALLHKPRLLILDEPINGLDPEGIVEVRALLNELAAGGTTVFLSSHILGEIAKIANRIGIIHQGRLVTELSTAELAQRLQKKVVVQTRDGAATLALLATHYTAAVAGPDNTVEISNPQALQQPEQLASLLVREGLPPRQLQLVTEDLEHFFLRTIRS